MINASTIGWVEKFLKDQQSKESIYLQIPKGYYSELRDCGFVYGFPVRLPEHLSYETKGWSSDELMKIVLLDALYFVYTQHYKRADAGGFLKSLVQFYDIVYPKSKNFFSKLLPEDSLATQIEKHISNRVQLDDKLWRKNFLPILTNALVFADVLTFVAYLEGKSDVMEYLSQLERTILYEVSKALAVKKEKTKYDLLLLKLFRTSVRFQTGNVTDQAEQISALNTATSNFEKYYLLDLVVMALWSDAFIEPAEIKYVQQWSDALNIDNAIREDSITVIDTFIKVNRNDIPYFNDSNPIKNFYDQTTQTVVKLILRNKKRLTQEIGESKELMVLLAASTHRDLDAMEKKKVKNQLLDICKSIPSLTIFLLPGGSLLLPILIRFIPQILPSAFNENLEK
jgi:hypothetical protein